MNMQMLSFSTWEDCSGRTCLQACCGGKVFYLRSFQRYDDAEMKIQQMRIDHARGFPLAKFIDTSIEVPECFK